MIKNLCNKLNEFETDNGKYEYYLNDDNTILYQRLSRPIHKGSNRNGLVYAEVKTLKYYDGSEYSKLVGYWSTVGKYIDLPNIGSNRQPEYIISKK